MGTKSKLSIKDIPSNINFKLNQNIHLIPKAYLLQLYQEPISKILNPHLTSTLSKLLKAITKHLETAEKKAIIYIDAIETDTDDDNGDNGEIPGCTDSTATNYDESATQDDGSCEQPSEDSENMILYGLMAATALSVSVLIYVREQISR